MYDVPASRPAPVRAPGPVIAGALVFGSTYGLLVALLGAAAAYMQALAGAAICILAFVAVVVITWFIWRGRGWAAITAVVFAVVFLAGSAVALARPETGYESTPQASLACPLVMLGLTVGLLVVPQSSRRWFWG